MSKSGTRAPNGSGTLRPDGYRQIRLPEHPVATKRGYAFMHRVALYDQIGAGSHECHYCQVIVTWGTDLEVDHLDHDRQNNVPENLVPCCGSCNRARWNRQKTQCPYDHGPYDAVYPNGHRYCKQCKNIKEKKRQRKIRRSSN